MESTKKTNQKDYWVVENIQSSSHAKDSQIMGCRKNQSSSHAKDSQIMGCRKILK